MGIGNITEAKSFKVMMLSRRTLNLSAICGLATSFIQSIGLSAAKGSSNHRTIPGTDTNFGDYTQSWFLQSFLELADDLYEAKNNGKIIMRHILKCLNFQKRNMKFCVKWELQNFIWVRLQIL